MADIHFVIFSKDRACQADQLLRSLADHIQLEYTIDLIYFGSDEDYNHGYRQLLNDHPYVNGINESNRPIDDILRRIIETAKAKYFATLVDDDVIIRDVKPSDYPWQELQRNPSICCLCLRLSPYKTYSQPSGQHVHVPKIQEGIFDFQASLPLFKRGFNKFRKLIGIERQDLINFASHWRLLFSVDGNIFRREQFHDFCCQLPKFEHVTSIEPMMMRHRSLWQGPQFGILYEQERLLNLVINNVDSQGARYPHPGYNASTMNLRYLQGQRLDYKIYENRVFDACHLETRPIYIPDRSVSMNK